MKRLNPFDDLAGLTIHGEMPELPCKSRRITHHTLYLVTMLEEKLLEQVIP
jgi:hypothetical protein